MSTQAQTHNRGNRAPSPPSSAEVLIVEDDTITRKALSQLISGDGHAVTAVGRLTDAMDLLERHFDAMIVDLMLPDGNGIKLLQAVRARHLPTRVIVTTGLSDEYWLDQVRAAQPDMLLFKPVDIPRLLQSITDSTQ